MKTKLLDLLLFSEKRKNLIILLRDGPRTLTEIKLMLNVTSPGIIPQMRMLEQRNIIVQDNKAYSLTEKGQLLSEYIDSLVKIIDVIEKNENFFNTHDMSIIPDYLFKRIHEFGDCEVDEVDMQSMYEPHRLFFKNLLISKWIKGVTPIFNPSYPDLFLQLAEKGKNINLILTPEVYKRIQTEHSKSINTFLNLNNTKMHIYNKELNLAMIITDSYFSFTPFLNDGSYDSKRNLVSSNPSAISWGEEIFEYLLKNSHEILICCL